MKNYADIISKANNAILMRNAFIDLKFSRVVYNFIIFLFKNKFIKNFVYNEKQNNFRIYFKYLKNKNVIQKISLISKKTKIITLTYYQLKKLNFKKGCYILTTAKGLLTVEECILLNTGGIVLCYIV